MTGNVTLSNYILTKSSSRIHARAAAWQAGGKNMKSHWHCRQTVSFEAKCRDRSPVHNAMYRGYP